jgi:signal transduction histidine kinase
VQTRILGIAEAHTEQLGYRPQLHFTGPIDSAVDEPLAADILAVTREALSNCARHAAASTVSVSVGVAHDVLTLEITDNGAGLGTPTRSSGLSNIRRRAENHGGTLSVTEPDAGGTRLTWSVICAPVRPA